MNGSAKAAATMETRVKPSRIGETLRAARGRLGWSRDAMAFHSGVSASAIAQIESGRRREVRLSSLAALADALSVSVDYLIGTETAITAPMVEHAVLAYASEGEFLATTVPFLALGIERSEPVLVVTTPAHIQMLRDSLNDRPEQVRFADSGDWLTSPNEAMRLYAAWVKQRFDDGAVWVRILGEPSWSGRSDNEIVAWTRFESLLNIAWACMPATILCPYDARALHPAIVADAHRTHPAAADGTEVSVNPEYCQPEDFLLEARAAS
jgi:transcriptional regulator with XRE-family HTH domain